MASALNDPLPAAVIGITTATAFFSANLGLSFVAIPAVLLPEKSPSNLTSADNSDTPLLARQWSAIYNRGHRLGPATAIFSAASFFYAASKLPQADTTRRTLLFTSAGLALAVFPYTWFWMLKINNELHRRAGTLGTSLSAKVKTQPDRIVMNWTLTRLIETWADMGVIRALWPLAGAIVGFVAVFI